LAIRLAIFNDRSYTFVMEMTISIPRDMFQRADEIAQKLGLTRDELYTQALKRFLENYSDDEITRQLNEVYERVDSSLDPVLMRMQLTAIDQEKW
jgi:metal-responsive CopG/Arc/MetJ family transcriptional regulator